MFDSECLAQFRELAGAKLRLIVGNDNSRASVAINDVVREFADHKWRGGPSKRPQLHPFGEAVLADE